MTITVTVPILLLTKTIDGALPSLKNQRRIVTNRRTGKPMSIKSKDAMSYAQSFDIQLSPKDRIGYDGPVSLRCRVWYPSRRNDLDIEYLCDLLQQTGVLVNDRQIHHKESWKDLDRGRPRIHFSLYRWEEGTNGR